MNQVTLKLDFLEERSCTGSKVGKSILAIWRIGAKAHGSAWYIWKLQKVCRLGEEATKLEQDCERL